jgi:hypothetical protein
MKSFWFTLILLLPFNLFSQIKVDKAGDGWDSIVYSAIDLIKKHSPLHYTILLETTQKIEFWNEDYSSNDIIEGKGVIVISAKDIKLGSLNNIAAALAHESLHLRFLKSGPTLRGCEEEYMCYSYELKLLKLLPNVEPDLLAYTKEQTQLWNIK